MNSKEKEHNNDIIRSSIIKTIHGDGQWIIISSRRKVLEYGLQFGLFLPEKVLGWKGFLVYPISMKLFYNRHLLF